MRVSFFDKIVFYMLVLRCMLNAVYSHEMGGELLGGRIVEIFNALNLGLIIFYFICNVKYLNKIFGFFFLVGLFIVSVVLSSLLSPVFSGEKIVDLFKILSWMLYYPVMHVFLIKYKNERAVIRIGIYCSILTIVFILLFQIFKVGATAYDLGKFYLGFYSSESIIALTLCSNLFFWVDWCQVRGIKIFHLFFITLSFIFSLLIMVRSAFLVSIEILLSYYFIFSKKKYYKILSSTVGVVAITSLVFYYVSSNPEYYEARFKDIENYSQSNNIESVGSGRVSLIIHYWKIFSANSFEEKFFGLLTLNTRGIIFGTHNDILQILFLSGYFGLSIYLLIWALFIFKFLKNFSKNEKKVNVLYFNVFFAYFIYTLRGAVFQIYPMIVLMLMLAIASSCSGGGDESRVSE